MKLALTLLWSLPVLALELSSHCPPSTKLQDGLCYYDIPYNNELADNGFKKPFPVFRNGFAPKVVDLGRLLFFDPLLSERSDVSCAHCHRPDQGFSDGRARSQVPGSATLLKRSAPTLWNVAFHREFFWDGRAKNLEDQAMGPLFSADEMGNTPESLEKRLNDNQEYKRLFAAAFGNKFQGRITSQLVTRAISDFERTLVSMNSRYDRYVYGEKSALNEKEVRGLTLFRSFLTRCTECHTPPLFTNFQTAIIGAPESSGTPFDKGREEVVQDVKQRGAFKVPSLRNIGLTAPYMHSGGFKDLGEVVRFYNEGGGRGLLGVELPYLHWHMAPIKLSKEEQESIVAFLKSLTDEKNLPTHPEELPSGLQPISGGKHAL